MELKAVMLNINRGHNPAIMSACKTLRDYSEYIGRIREYAGSMSLEEATKRTIDECIREGILAEFLSRNRAEAKKMVLYDFDQENYDRIMKAEAHEDGECDGMRKGIIVLLEELGEIPVELREKIMEEYDVNVLTLWLKYAVKVDSVEEFAEYVREKVPASPPIISRSGEKFMPYDYSQMRRELFEQESRAKSFEEGEKFRRKEAILVLLEELGEVPDELREKVMGESDKNILRSWLKYASKVNSIEEFTQGI